jgi:hypothetical protein
MATVRIGGDLTPSPGARTLIADPSHGGNDEQEETSMETTIRARVKRGRLEPLEELGLPEGREVTLTIVDEPIEPSDADVKASLAAAGGWKGIVNCDRFLRDLYRSRNRISRRKVPRL